MFQLSSSLAAIGFESTPSGVIKIAKVIAKHNNFFIDELLTIHSTEESIHSSLNKDHPYLVTGLENKELLIRFLTLPLTKDKDIAATLPFQAEPLLPYPIEEALLSYQIHSKTSHETALTLFAARRETVQAHLNQWQMVEVEPEIVSTLPSALCQFGATYLPAHRTVMIVHGQSQAITCLLIREGKLIGSFAQNEGLSLLLKAQMSDGRAALPQTKEEWAILTQNQDSHLAMAVDKLQKGVIKMKYALAKDLKEETLEGIIVTGDAASYSGLSELVSQTLELPLLTCTSNEKEIPHEWLHYALPIGLALCALTPSSSPQINFRQQELRYPYPWQRLKIPLATYFLAISLLTAAFYFFSQHYLSYQEDQLKQAYVDLLASMNKSPEQFETVFLEKSGHQADSPSNEIVRVEQLNQQELMQRLSFLQKDLQSIPDSFPLFANTPRASDVLAWLNQHPAIVYEDEAGNRHARLQIENFNYTMIKRPQHGKKQERYQVKVELELVSDIPKWAREFHDALITPNDWVDAKGEIKWSSNRGKYKTSFYLKDKTVYQTS